MNGNPPFAATREQVLEAYRSNPLAQLNPEESAINYWMGQGLGSFGDVVSQVRAANPTLAAQIDAERRAATSPLSTVTSPAPPPMSADTQAYFNLYPDIASAYQQNTYGLTPDEFAQTHFQRYGQAEGRTFGAPAPIAPAPTGGLPTAAASQAPAAAAPATTVAAPSAASSTGALTQSGLSTPQSALQQAFAQNPNFANDLIIQQGMEDAAREGGPRAEVGYFNVGDYSIRPATWDVVPQEEGVYNPYGAKYKVSAFELYRADKTPEGKPLEFTSLTDDKGNITSTTVRYFTGGDSGIVFELDAQGNQIGQPRGFDYSEDWKAPTAAMLSMAAAAFAGPLSNTLAATLGGGTATLASNIAANAIVRGGLSAAQAALTGGDPLKAGLTGAVTGAVGVGAAQIANDAAAQVLSATGSQVAADAVRGAVQSGLNAVPGAVVSGDLGGLGKAALTGAVTSGIGSAASQALSGTGITSQQISSGLTLAQQLQSKNPSISVIANAAAGLVNSPDATVAAKAISLVDTISKAGSNPMALMGIMDAAAQLNQAVDAAQGKTAIDPASSAFAAAKRAGATDDEAAAAARQVAGGDAIDRATAQATGLPIIQGAIPEIEIIDEEYGDLTQAQKDAAQRNTLKIGAGQANTPEEAAALAKSKGFGMFEFGGNRYTLGASVQEVLAAAGQAEQAKQEAGTTATNSIERLGDEYARSLGKKDLSQLTPQEADDFGNKLRPFIEAGPTVLKGASLQDVLSGNVSTVPMQLERETWSGEGPYRVEIKGIGSTGEVSGADKAADQMVNWLNTIEGDKGKTIRQGISTIIGGVGEQVADLGTALANMNITDRYNTLVKIGQFMESIGQDLEIPEVTKATQNFIKSIEESPTYAGKVAAGLKAIYDQPLALVQGVKEVGQEILPILTGVGAARFGGKLAGVAADVLMNSAESMGSQSRQTYREEIEAGKTPQEAAEIADRKGFIAGGITAAFGGVLDASALKAYEKVADKVVNKSLSASGKEWGTEGGEEFLISLATGDDLATAISKSVVGSFVGAKASGTVQAAADIQSDLAAAFAEEGYTSTDGSFSPQSLVKAETAGTTTGAANVLTSSSGSTVVTSGGNVTATAPNGQTTNISVTQNDVSSGNVGSDVQQAVSNGADAATVISNVSTAATNSGANAATAVNQAVDAANAAGANVTVSGNTVNNTQTTGNVTTNTSANTGTGVTQSTSVNNNTGTKTETTTDQNAGTVSQTQTNTATGVNTQTNTNTNTGVNTQTTTNTNTGVNTQTETNTNTGVNTNTTTDTNTNTTTQTNTDTKTNVTTQTSVNNNTGVTTNVVSDPNTNTQTTTTTDTNTNTETTTTVDTNTNTQTTVVVNTETGEVVDRTEGPITDYRPLDPVPPVTSVPPVTEVAPGVDVTKKPKITPKVAPPTEAASMMIPSLGGMMNRGSLDPTLLRSFETQGYIDPLAALKAAQAETQGQDIMQNVDPRLAAILQQRMGQQPEQDSIGALARVLSGEPEAVNSPYYSYGQEDSIDDIMGGKASGFAQGGYVSPLQMADGGMPMALMAKEGGRTREDFRHGKHVAGEGDGQSDDIPAWLADGEFVFPADVVSALGNGSTKAGTDKLYEMMHNIRDRARSKGPKDLPPPALKSPLDYLKSKR